MYADAWSKQFQTPNIPSLVHYPPTADGATKSVHKGYSLFVQDFGEIKSAYFKKESCLACF